MPNPVIPDQNKIFDLKIANTDYPCSLPMDMGMCFAYLRRYYYKSDEARCVEFIFGGCRGNFIEQNIKIQYLLLFNYFEKNCR